MSRTVVVTGGSRGIGKAICIELSKLGFDVVINFCNDEASALDTKNIIKELGGSAEIFKADVSKKDEVKALIDFAVKSFGGVDVLVSNAGVSYIGLLTDMTEDDVSKVLNVNLLGCINVAKEVVPYMVSKKQGRIINISSMWGEVGASCEAVYSASKAGIIGFTKALAKELGPSGITVNCVTPGVIETDMNKELCEEDLKALIDETSLLRLGKPEDVAKAVCFLASDNADFITGEILKVNGGICI